MKNRILLFTFLLLGMATYSQSPQGFTYQAVIRDAGDALIANSSIGMRISILQTSASGTVVYEETQTPTSNANGLVTLTVGSGSVVSGSIASIDWSAGPYFIKTETDPTGGSSYTISGVSQMMSVPFALYAANSQAGPQGPAGAVGPMGPQGPAGLDGADGLDGATGPMGPQGPAGLDGADGLDGATGPMGPQGPAGLDGADGLDGATGPMGPQGPAGLDGANGLDGATGPQGPVGATGPQGPAGTYTAGSGIDITGSVISATGSGAMPEYAYANIGNASTLGAQSLTAVSPPATYVNGVVMNGSSITLHANKLYEVSVAFYIYNATGGHTFRLKDATNNAYLATELYFGQGGSDVSYNISTTSCLIKPSTDILLELEKSQGTDVNLIGKMIVKEIK